METEVLNQLGYEIIGAAFEVRRELGSYLLENFYEAAMECELKLRGISSERQVSMPCLYKGNRIDLGYRADLLVEKEIVVELKAHNSVIPDNYKQLTSYLHVAGLRLGYLINFGARNFRVARSDEWCNPELGIYRIVNGI